MGVQPTYVRVTVRGRVLQLVLNVLQLVRGGRELRAHEASLQRSLSTGHLLVRIPFVCSYPTRFRMTTLYVVRTGINTGMYLYASFM